MRRIIMNCWTPVVVVLAAGSWIAVAAAEGVDFEDLSLAPDSYWIGYDSQPYPIDNVGEEHPFTSRGVTFYNYHIYGWTSDWEGYEYTYWEGWGYSNKTDNVTPGYGNQFSAIAGGGVAGSSNFGVAYLPETSAPSADAFRRVDVALAQTGVPDRYGVYVTNTTYDYYPMRDGDQFAKKFGYTWDSDGQVWVDTKDQDWFKLIITGLDADDAPIPGLQPVKFFLADFTAPDNADDYIVADWRWVNLSSLVDGGAQKLQFVLDSSDRHPDYGINTPLFFAIDAVPEPSTTVLLVSAALCGVFWCRHRRKIETYKSLLHRIPRTAAGEFLNLQIRRRHESNPGNAKR